MFREAAQEFCDLKYKVGERNAVLWENEPMQSFLGKRSTIYKWT